MEEIMDLLNGLNKEQEEAVLHNEGPLLILAGAGSGKTRVLTHRIAYLIKQQGIFPSSILAITFTNKAAKEMRSRIDAVANQAAAATTTPKVYHEVWNEPLMSVGPGTFIDELMTLAGGENIFHDAISSFPIVSSETVIEKNPDVIIFPHMYMGTVAWGTYDDIAGRPGWDTITAIKNDNFYIIDASIISRSGPRLADALEEVAVMIHPELFG